MLLVHFLPLLGVCRICTSVYKNLVYNYYILLFTSSTAVLYPPSSSEDSEEDTCS